MKFDEIIQNLQNKIYSPIYFLMGEEPYYIDEITNYIADHILNETEKEFNQTVVYGRDTDILSIISYAKRFPMMANYQVVIVKEAQDLKNLFPESKEKETKKDKDKNPFEAYIENPLKSTILVFCYKYKTLDRRKSITKLLEKNGVLYHAEKLRDNQLPSWIHNFLKKKNYTIHPETAVMLSEYLGTDLSKITNELSKLAINVPEGTEITPIHIEQYIGISKDFNVFELQKALGKKDFYKSIQIANYFAANAKDNPNVKTIPILYSYFSKILLFHYTPDKSKNSICSALSIHPFFYDEYVAAARNFNSQKSRQIISLLRKYDLKSKGVENASIPDGELLKELIFQILH